MLSLLLAIVCSSLVSVIMRLSGDKVKHNLGMLTGNYIVCALLAGTGCGFSRLFDPSDPAMAVVTAMGAVNGLLYLAGFVLMQVNIRHNGVVLSSIFQKLGLLVTLVVSVCIYHEIPTAVQAVGFLLAVAAIILMNYRGGGATAGYKAGLLWMLLACGMADAMSKIFTESGVPALEGQFLFFTFATAMVFCFLCMRVKGQKIGMWELAFGVLIAVPNFFSSKFLLGALESMAAVIVYPVFSVGSILAVTLAGVLVFRERLEKRQWAALAMILVALVLLNL